jgi:phenylacetate-CoA ligase
MDRLGLTVDAFRTAADLSRLPIVERDHVQRDPERFLSTTLPRDRYVQLATEGSTGAPVLVLHDPFALFQGVAHYERGAAVAWRLAGRRLVLRRALVGLPTGTTARTRGAVRGRSIGPAGLRYRDISLSMADPLPDNAQRLLDFAPDEVRGYGSYLEELFIHIRRSGRTTGLPRVIVFGDDSMSAPARRMITEELGVPVLSEYGAGEAHHVGFECEEHKGLHVNDDIYPTRIVDGDGIDVRDDEPGEIVVSNLVNRGTVLLNYRLGDVVRRLSPACPCGRTLPLISFPQGRTDEWFISGSGQWVHGQEVRGLLLADDSFLLGFQVVQESAHQFAVAVVTRDGCDREKLRAGVERRFAERFGSGTTTRVSFVETLTRTSGGKVRTVVSRAGVRRPPRADA